MVTSSYESKNSCYSCSSLSEEKFRQSIRFFAMNFTASDTAKFTDISLRSINTIHIKLRKKTAAQCEEISRFNGVIEFDASYFGVRSKRSAFNSMLWPAIG